MNATAPHRRYCAFCDNTGWRTPGLYRKFECDQCHRGAERKREQAAQRLSPTQAELVAATEARDRILDQLEPFNREIEHGDGWYARAHRVRHDQLLRRLELAEDRVARAQAELTAPTLPSALLA